MSIHVTVNADPVCIRRGGLMLSDLEQIKKYERGRRRRLRLEQVRQQSKNIASRILEQTKNIARKELHNLENNEDSKLKRMHEQKIMEIQRRYQEDMEAIGMAHEAAQSEPNPEVILKSKKLKNQIAANERGKEAAKRVKEAAKIDDEHEKHQERLRQVREIEDIRSSMISNLPKKVPCKKSIEPEASTAAPPQSSHHSTNPPSTSKTPQQSPRKRNDKKVRSKISEVPKIKITTRTSKKSSPQEIQVEVHREATPELNPSEIDYIEVPCSSQCYRRSESNSEIPSNKLEKSSPYNPSDYQNDLIISSNESSLSSLISDDSSYFSDRPTPTTTPNVSENLPSSKHCQSSKNSEIKLYDYTTRQRNSYNHPKGIVEREDIKNLPNAEEMARKITQTENNQINTIDNQRLIAKKRGNDAILREKVRRDYHNLMKNLDHLSREERKLKASQITDQQETNYYLDRSRRRELNEIRQRKIEEAFENAQNNIETHPEAVITLHRNTKSPTRHEPTRESPVFNNDNEQHNELSREEQILEMLQKVERQKRLLLQEFGATLPNDILNATTTSLFNETKCEKICRKNFEAKQTTASPEIEVINMSKLSEKKSQKHKKKLKKSPKSTATTSHQSKITPTSSSTSEIAVQTQIEYENDKIIGEDKSIQVELSPEHLSRPTMTKNDSTTKSERPEHIEPVVTIITHSSGDVSTSNSSDHGIVINVGRGRVEVTPRKSSKRVKTRSLPSSEYGSPIKRLPIAPSSSSSAPASRAATPEQFYHDSASSSSTPQVESGSENEPSRSINKISMQHSRITEVSVGTDSSHASPNEHDTSTQAYVLPKRRIRYKETSDTSTSYASLPQISKQTHEDGIISNITSILELVDSSGNETITRMRANISPVSTPETPSPRTMRIPSNLPNAERVTRILTFDERPEVHNVDSTNDNNENMNVRRVIRKNVIYKRTDMTNCECANPKCKEYSKQGHKIDEVDVDANDNNQLDALKFDEELQNSCTEKIASLTAMINRIRDEKCGIDFSMFAPSDDTSLMQMPEPKSTSGDGVVGLQNLVQNIEQVHDRLKQMLTDSQNTFKTRRFKAEEFSLSPIGNDSMLVSDDDDAKRKPKIISNERVHFDIQKMKKVNAASQSVGLEFYQSDDGSIVEKLSQEILEQSKDVEKNMQRDLAMEKTPEKSGKFEENEGTSTSFPSILADIPKIPKKSSTPFGNGQSRSDAKFVRPELSTIDELDTSGTVNRSGISVNRSPIKQSRQQTPRSSYNEQQKQQQSSPSVKNSSTSARKSGKSDKEKTDKHTSPISILKDSSQHDNQHGDTGENLPIEKSVKSPDSFLTHYSTRNIGAGDFFNQINIKNAITEYETQIKCEKITSSSSNSLSAFSGISEILTSTSLDSIAASPPENMEFQLKKLGLSWLIPIAKKTRKASALSSSSNSDTTLTINKRTKSSVKKFHDGISCAYLDFSDVSSISIREASKSTEKTVLMKARTSTPNIPNFYCTSDKSNLTTTSTTSGKSLQHDYSDSLASKTLAIH